MVVIRKDITDAWLRCLQMDGTLNEHADLKVEGFPTLLFYPCGADQAPITFDGDRTLKVRPEM